MGRPAALAPLLLALIAGLAAPFAAAAESVPVAYRVETLRRSLLLLDSGREEPLAVGATLVGGQQLRTGWFSAADLAAAQAATLFHLGSRTRVQLGGDRPAVLLVLERGLLRAFFDQLTGTDAERQVETPSAVLAVRGTEVEVRVDGRGTTLLTVWSGVVEVRDPAGRFAPVSVQRGQAVRVERGRPPGPPQRAGAAREGRGNRQPAGEGDGPHRGSGSRGRRGGG